MCRTRLGGVWSQVRILSSRPNHKALQTSVLRVRNAFIYPLKIAVSAIKKTTNLHFFALSRTISLKNTCKKRATVLTASRLWQLSIFTSTNEQVALTSLLRLKFLFDFVEGQHLYLLEYTCCPNNGITSRARWLHTLDRMY